MTLTPIHALSRFRFAGHHVWTIMLTGFSEVPTRCEPAFEAAPSGMDVLTFEEENMTEQEANQMISSLELIIKNLEYPMYLTEQCGDKEVKKKLGELFVYIVSEIDLNLIPYLKNLPVSE
ncbi:hypothetical protein M2322_003215 [Rhodoblastus acidophilus]|uniref:hypothetical protein n=1 Tax=Rhodoblastus acidophilus TaxID=1074 RepID=UPI002224A2B9|nr:hypothetical protein [Rhodoblastus acidophilus]MCW2317651.1 hypothetical protein [Rhodoblastus acidophilus]